LTAAGRPPRTYNGVGMAACRLNRCQTFEHHDAISTAPAPGPGKRQI
jgi:hypothetical protein